MNFQKFQGYECLNYADESFEEANWWATIHWGVIVLSKRNNSVRISAMKYIPSRIWTFNPITWSLKPNILIDVDHQI